MLCWPPCIVHNQFKQVNVTRMITVRHQVKLCPNAKWIASVFSGHHIYQGRAICAQFNRKWWLARRLASAMLHKNAWTTSARQNGLCRYVWNTKSTQGGHSHEGAWRRRLKSMDYKQNVERLCLNIVHSQKRTSSLHPKHWKYLAMTIILSRVAHNLKIQNQHGLKATIWISRHQENIGQAHKLRCTINLKKKWMRD